MNNNSNNLTAYIPQLKEGHKLLNSRNNQDLVRGLSRDNDGNNPDIPEWKPICIKQSSETKDVLIQAGIELAVDVSKAVLPIVVSLACDKLKKIKEKKNKRKQKKSEMQIKALYLETVAELKTKCFDENAETSIVDTSQHIALAVCQILLIAKEAQSATLLKCKHTDKLSEIISTTAVEFAAESIDDFLSQDGLEMDNDTANKVVIWLGGGITRNGCYLPVNPKLIQNAMMSIKT